MTMQNHITHWHWPEWENIKSHLQHVVHDPRFWTILIVCAALAVMLFAAIFTDYGSNLTDTTHGYPMYPLWP